MLGVICEDICLEAFDFLLANAADPSAFPNRVKTLASEEIRSNPDTTQIWKLAGSGWKFVLQSHREAAIKKWLNKLNTPKTEQVNDLFQELLGLTNLSSSWTWQGMNSQQASEKLDEYIVVRGNIAHRTIHDENVYKSWGTDFLSHVERLVEKTDESVRRHVNSLIQASPWPS